MEGISRFLRSKYFWYMFAALTVIVYFFGLTIPLLGPDEPRYAQVAREMYLRGDWVTPTLGGHNWFEKPALLYWLQIAAFNLFGVSEFAARLGSALFGLGTIGSLWVLGDRFFAPNRDLREANGFGSYLALFAASTLGIIVFSRGASFDIILTFPITAACAGFFLYDHYSQNTDKSGVPWLIAFYAFAGVAVLAKGLVGIVFPFAIAMFYLALSFRLPTKKLLLSLLWGMPLVAAIAALWYVPMYLTHGWEFIDQFFVQHHFQRYTSNKYQHPQPFHFFFWVLPLMTIPWLPFFLAGSWSGAKQVLMGGDDIDLRYGNVAYTPLLLFAGAWLAVPLVFFSFSGSKLPGYILPAVPPAIVIIAIFAYRWIGDRAGRELLVKSIATATLLVVVGLLVFVVPGFAERDSVKTLIAAADARGNSGAKVVGLHTVSHNAEFYASGRLLRGADGKQKKLLGPSELSPAIDESGGSELLVLVPVEWVREIENVPNVSWEFIATNDELVIGVIRK
jgi:4-amino-4-deoxy-L-arabinose transferase-like glycosyltransferase